jgi:hypothetical protein
MIKLSKQEQQKIIEAAFTGVVPPGGAGGIGKPDNYITDGGPGQLENSGSSSVWSEEDRSVECKHCNKLFQNTPSGACPHCAGIQKRE